MLHAYFTPIVLCFIYTLWHFYAFSRTNLLMRCHSASSLFSVVFVFQKSYTWNILGIDLNMKAEVLIYPTRRRIPKERRRGARGQPHHRVAWATPWSRHHVVWTPGPPLDIALPPINSLQRENPKKMNIFHETYCKPPPSSSRDWEGLEALPSTLPERGIITEGLLHHHASLQSDVCVVYLRLWVHSNS
jgi:hypothetical protein